MAIIRPGPLAGAISGRLGGLVFVAGKGSPFVRPRPAPMSNTSARLLTRQSFFGRITNAWAALTDTEKATWATAAALISTTNRLGSTKRITGFLYFIMTNTQGQLVKGLITTIPPGGSLFPGPSAITTTFSASGNYTITATKPIGVAFITWTMFGWAFMRNTTPGAIARPVFLDDTFNNTDLNHNIKSAWTARFGEVQEGQHFTVDVMARVNTNPLTPKVRATGIAIA